MNLNTIDVCSPVASLDRVRRLVKNVDRRDVIVVRHRIRLRRRKVNENDARHPADHQLKKRSKQSSRVRIRCLYRFFAFLDDPDNEGK
jgi:hypothetical protein